MSLETDLSALLLTVCPRVSADVAPAGTAKPFITWQQVGGDVIQPISGLPDKRNALVQINCWAERRADANALALAVEAALVGTTVFVARPQSALVATNDDDTDLRGAMQDFSIWAAR